MRTILVTGGAGFIGGCFVRTLVAKESYRIVNLDALTYAGNLESLQSINGCAHHHFVEGDIRDTSLVARLLAKYEPIGVVHFAAESHVDRSIGAPAQFIHTNVVGTQNLLEAVRAYWAELGQGLRQKFRFLHVSTDEVYGSLGDEGKFTEQTPYAPNSPYSASKAASDHLVRAYHHTYGLPTLISNCSNNYGPFQFPEKLIPLMVLNALEQQRLPVYGDGSNVRDWLHVEDHCEALCTILQRGRPGEVYNVGGNAERTNLQVVTTICHWVNELREDKTAVPAESLIEYVTDRPGHDHRYAIDASKIESELGWTPRHSFEDGIRDTVQWYLQNRPWWESVCSGKYQRQRLGLMPSLETVEWTAQTQPAETYTEGEIEGVRLQKLGQFCDERGWLTELFRHDELDPQCHAVMAYVSETEPQVVRGPHEHVEQTDYFAFIGPGEFDLFLWDSRPDSPTYGNKSVARCGEQNRVAVIVPPGVVHAYKNVSDVAGWVFNAANRLYAGPGKRFPVDEIRHEGDENSPYKID